MYLWFLRTHNGQIER